jgi:hypothetical protein
MGTMMRLSRWTEAGVTGIRPRFILVAAFLLFSLVAVSTASALSTLSEGYLTTDKVSLGSIVSLQKNSTDHVSAATIDNVSNMLGVVVSDGNSLLSLTDGRTNQIQVVTSGVVDVLVSDINGGIKQGDQITASPVAGVGMKATSNVKVIGTAQADVRSSTASKQTYKDKAGASHQVTLGQVPILVNVAYFYKQPEKTLIPSAVQSIANALAGKAVSAVPILICMGIFLITMIVVASIIYSMIRSSIISVGRNPMSQAAVYRNLTQMSALVVGILTVSTAAIYLILKKF